jgi:hypothetical protein
LDGDRVLDGESVVLALDPRTVDEHAWGGEAIRAGEDCV